MLTHFTWVLRGFPGENKKRCLVMWKDCFCNKVCWHWLWAQRSPIILLVLWATLCLLVSSCELHGLSLGGSSGFPTWKALTFPFYLFMVPQENLLFYSGLQPCFTRNYPNAVSRCNPCPQKVSVKINNWGDVWESEKRMTWRWSKIEIAAEISLRK